MATTEELTEQLNIATKLGAVIERMASTLDKIEKSYANQVDIVTKLTAAMKEMSPARLAQETDKLTQSAKLSSQATETLAKKTAQGADSMKSLGDRAVATARSLSSKFPKSVVIATAAISGFVQGVKNIVGLSKSVLGFATSLASSMFNIGLAIATIPIKIFTRLVDLAANADTGSNELLQALENLRKEMGNLSTAGAQAVIQTSKTLQGFSDTGLSTWKVFGTLAERLEYVTKVAVAMGATFGQLKGEFIANGGAILAFQKGLGITEENMKAVGDRALTEGKRISTVLLTATKQTLALGKAFDVDQKLIGKDIASAVKDVRHFGAVTVKEIGQASVYARKLGIELDKIVGTLDAFETFDSAAENAAKLSQSFGVTIDAFKLMEAQSPAEQVDMLRKQFRQAGVDASNFNRQQLRLLSTTTGLDEATAKQVFSMQNQGASLEDIKKKSEVAEKKTLTQAEAMQKLAASIERLVKQGPALTGGFFDMFFRGILRGVQSSKDFVGTIYNIRKALHQVYMIGVQLGRLLPTIVPGLGNFLRGLREFFDPKKYVALFKGISQAAQGLIKGDQSLPATMDKLRDQMLQFFSASSPAARKIFSGFQDIIRFLGKQVTNAIPWVTEKIRETLTFITDVLTGRQSLASLGVKAGGAGNNALGFLQEVLTPIGLALADSWKVLKQPLLDLLTVLGKKMVEFFKSDEFQKFASPIKNAIIAMLVGPTVLRGVAGAVFSGLTSKLFGGGTVKSLIAGAEKQLSKTAGTAVGSRALGVTGVGALAVAAVSMAKGVNDYTKKITSTMDQSSKTLAGAATGLIDGITLGLLPDDFTVKIADTLAEAADGIFDALGSVFGRGFIDSLKRRTASIFDVAGGVYGFFAELFTGDQASFERSAADLGYSLLRFAVSSFEFLFVQLPVFVGKMAIKVGEMLSQVGLKISTAIWSPIAAAGDALTGGKLGLQDKLHKLSASVSEGMKSFTASATKWADEASEGVASATAKFSDEYLRSAAQKKEIAESAAQSVVEAQKKEAKTATETVNKSLSSIASDLRAAKELQAELGSGVDIKKLFDDLRAKFAGANFSVIEPSQAASLEEATKSLEVASHAITEAQAVAKSIDASTKDFYKIIKRDAMVPALKAIESMVKLVNDMDSALADGNINKINIKAKLANVANAVGLGGKAQYSINSKPVNITINLEVKMSAEELETALIMRGKSIIRDRLNFATSQPNAQGNTTIPDQPTKNFPLIGTGG